MDFCGSPSANGGGISIASNPWSAGLSGAGLFLLQKEVFNLVEVFETAKLPRATGRFIN
jgi:hypothetical protein